MKKWILLIVLIILLAVTVFIVQASYSPQAHINKIRDEVAANNSYTTETPLPETYDSLSRTEYNKGINFPVKEAAYATLHSNSFFGSTNDLSPKQFEKLLTILNDSTNYEWGELGTPEVHYYFTFHDKKGNTFALTTIDVEGMAYSYPSLYRMKWGSLNKMDEVLKLIQEIEN